jgi:hypothetical protein
VRPVQRPIRKARNGAVVSQRAWNRGEQALANVSQHPVLVKMIPARGADDTAEEQQGQGLYVSCGSRAISKQHRTSARGRHANFMFLAAGRTCRQKRVEQQAAPGQEHDQRLA